MANDDPVKAASLSEQISTTDPAVLAAPAITIPPPQPPSAQAAGQQAGGQQAPQATAPPSPGVGIEGEVRRRDDRHAIGADLGGVGGQGGRVTRRLGAGVHDQQPADGGPIGDGHAAPLVKREQDSLAGAGQIDARRKDLAHGIR